MIYKIIICIVLGLIGFYAFLQVETLRDLKSGATEKEKKALDVIEIIATFSPLLIMYFIINPQ